MKRNLLLLPFILIILACSSTTKKTNLYDGDTFLWEVRNTNGNKAYLLGSIHIAKEDLYPLDKIIYDSFYKSDVLAVELDLENVNLLDLMKFMMYDNGQTLKENISEENYNRLKKIFTSNSIPEIAFSQYKPWAAAITAQQLLYSDEGYDEELGIDLHFLNKAKEKEMEIKELETAEFQMSLFSEFDKVGDAFVEYTLESSDKNALEIDRMFEAWESGNKKALNDILNQTQEDYPEFEGTYNKLIDERNVNMTEKIKGWLKTDETHFVVVGAGHLIGEKGIIKMLSDQGYEIRNY